MIDETPEWIAPGKIRYSVLFGGEGFLSFWGAADFVMRPPWRQVDKQILMDLKAESSVKKIADAGFNLIWTDFSNGRGPTAEKAMREEAKKFIGLCHQHGIRVLPYIQFANIWWQEFFMDFPQSIKWLARDAAGKPINYGESYWYRYLMCINQDEWMEYVKELVRDALVDGRADGIQLDNVNFPHCYCKTCQEKFREYLGSKFDGPTLLRRFEVRKLDDLKPPANVSAVKEPLVREWHRFKSECVARKLVQLKKYVRSLNPEAVLTGNGVVTESALARMFDMLFEERALYPRLDFVLGEQRLISTVPDYKWALSLTGGKMVAVDHHCRRGETGAWSAPNEFIHLWSKGATPSEAKLVMAEGFANGAYGVSPLSHEGQVLISEQTSDTLDAIKTYNHFLIKHEQYFVNLISRANVAVFKSLSTLSWDSSGWAHAMGFQQVLIQARIPYDVLVDTNLTDGLADYDTVILPNATCLSDEQIKLLREYVMNGGALIATGKTSLYNEEYEHRSDYGLAEVFGIHYDDELPEKVERQYFEGEVVFFPGHPEKYESQEFPWRPPGAQLLDDAVKRVTRLPLAVKAPNTVYVHIHGQENGRRLLVHLVNYEEKILEGIEAGVRIPEGQEVRRVLLLTPDREDDIRPQWKTEGENILIDIPFLATYDLAVVELKT